MPRAAKLSLLIALLAVCGIAALVQHQRERRRRAVTPSELYDVVWKQIAAIRSGDATSAYRQVSTGAQEKFPLESFADLSRAEYPAVRSAARVEFGAVRFEGARALVPVYFFTSGGDVIPCIYILIDESNSWKIDATRVLRRWPAGRRLGGMRA